MSVDSNTDWTVILAASQGCEQGRDRFAARYLGVVRRYLERRWRGQVRDIDDAVQEVFLDCFREQGALQNVARDHATNFRGYLYGVVRNVARRHEERAAARRAEPLVNDPASLPALQATPSVAMDQAWVTATLARAVVRQSATAELRGPAAARRVLLLRLRFTDHLPIREIARLWQVKPDWLHHQYAQARDEFRSALLAELAAQHPGTALTAEYACDMLLQLLQRPQERQVCMHRGNSERQS